MEEVLIRNPVKYFLPVMVALLTYEVSFFLPVTMRSDAPAFDTDTMGISMLLYLVTQPMCEPMGVVALTINGCFCIAGCLAFGRCWLGALAFSGLALVGAGVLVPLYMTPVNPDPELSLGPGYYLWVFSMALLVVTSFIRVFIPE